MNRTIHKFYVPEGVWYDITTGKKFPGGKSYVSFFREQDYPVFARSGAIIPLSNNENLNDTTPPKDLEIDIYPGRSNTYKIYEDDGLSDLYKKGFYLLTSIDYNYLPLLAFFRASCNNAGPAWAEVLKDSGSPVGHAAFRPEPSKSRIPLARVGQ